jgi:hypothetical protein
MYPCIITPAKVASDFAIWVTCGVKMNIMVEADIHLRLLLTSIVDTYNMFERLVCCLTEIREHPYTITQAKFAPDFGMWVTCGLKMMPLHHG